MRIRSNPKRTVYGTGVIAFLILASPAWATFHTYRINEVFSNSDGTIQFIELHEVFGFNSQHLFQGHTFTSNANSFVYPSNLPSSATANTSFVMATSGFAALPGAVTPDYIIPNNFFATTGDTLTLVGADTLAIDPVPVDGILSLNRDGSTAVNSPTNFAGETGSIDLSSNLIPKGDIVIELEPVAAGLSSPVYATHAGDGTGRLFVVDQAGFILIIDNGALLPTPFLDLTAEIPTLNAGFDERGLLGLAFHPDYASNGRFFVRYSKPRTGSVSDPCFETSRGCHEEILAEFAVSANPNVANPSPTVIFQVDEPQFNHNAGQVDFGPDGFLYFSLGDGGGANDGLADSPPSHGPDGNGQNIDTPLGAMLRIDVDGTLPYQVPPDNPFVGVDGFDEIYAYGFRNPYRFSFDDGPGGTGELWLADVGQALIEEIDIVEKGLNYGWVIKEGTLCFDPFNPQTPPASCEDASLTDPIAEYTHDDGLAIVGGFVYRGTDFPELVGKYVFGDFSRDFGPTGRLFYLDAMGNRSAIFEFAIGAGDTPLDFVLKGLGRGEEGELYALVSTDLGPTGTSGQVLRIRRGPDEDVDGVLDADDLCPGTPAGIVVGIDGCPVPIPADFDGDGDVDTDDLQSFDACANACIVANVNADTSGVNVLDLQFVKNNVFCTDATDSACTISDVNRDGNVNVIDLQEVKNVVFCVDTTVSVAPGCEWADFDGDSDVDRNDQAVIHGCLSGPGVPADPNCAD